MRRLAGGLAGVALAIAGGGLMPGWALAGGGASTEEDDVSVAARRVTLTAPADHTIEHGHRVKLRGAVAPAEKHKLVKLEYTPAGAKHPMNVDKTHTDRRGRFVLVHDPRFNGSFRAATSRGKLESDRVPIRVRAEIDARAERRSLVGRKVEVAGDLLPARKGREVEIERRTHDGWKRVARGKTTADKEFAAAWRPKKPGTVVLRASFAGDRLNEPDRTQAKSSVYREAVASFYGPGFYGRTTACGERLTRATIGVAHRSIDCGKKVGFYYRGKSLRMPVIDRGPFVKGREWDLTKAAAKRLGINGTAKVWSTR